MKINKWELVVYVGLAALFIFLMVCSYKSPPYSKNTMDALQQMKLGKIECVESAHAYFYDKEPCGTRAVKHSDQIIRSNDHSLYNHFSVEHAMTPGTYTSGQDDNYAEVGAYGHHKEGSARVTWSATVPDSNEEGRVWVDEDTYIVQVADSGGVWRNMTTAEVVSARGSRTSLDTRLDELMDNAGSLKPQNYNLGGHRILMAATPPTSGRELATMSYVLDMISGGGTVHADAHTDGTDDIQDATSAQKGLMTAAYATSVDSHAVAIATNTADIATNTANISTTNRFKRQIQTILGDETNQPQSKNVGYGSCLAFDPDTDEAGYFSLYLDDDSYGGNNLDVTMSYSASASHTGGFVFDIDWTAVASGEDTEAGGASGNDTVTITPGSNSTLHYDKSLTITSGNLADGDTVLLKLYRDADEAADNHTGDMYLFDVWIEED